MKILQRKISL